MKKAILYSAVVAAVLAASSCKKEGQDKPVVETEVLVDTAAAKKQVEAEKEKLSKPYNEGEDAQAKLDELTALAKSQGKNVFVQAGGNWCIWCLRFNDFVQNNAELKSLVDSKYVYYHLNYSTKNKNAAVFDKYAPNSKALGYPFFFVINGQGVVTSVFGSEKLESGKSYDVEKVKQMFLEHAAL